MFNILIKSFNYLKEESLERVDLKKKVSKNIFLDLFLE
jgi:hypothetical protein